SPHNIFCISFRCRKGRDRCVPLSPPLALPESCLCLQKLRPVGSTASVGAVVCVLSLQPAFARRRVGVEEGRGCESCRLRLSTSSLRKVQRILSCIPRADRADHNL